jgi:hypothetical protein
MLKGNMMVDSISEIQDDEIEFLDDKPTDVASADGSNGQGQSLKTVTDADSQKWLDAIANNPFDISKNLAQLPKLPTAQEQELAQKGVGIDEGSGEKFITGEVKVETNGIAPRLEITPVAKAGVLSLTPVEFKAPLGGQAGLESSVTLSAVTSGVPGDATRIRVGLSDTQGHEGATSVDGVGGWLSEKLRGLGLSKGFFGLQGDVLAGVGELKATQKWGNKSRDHEGKIDANAGIASANLRLIASGNLGDNVNLAAYGGFGGELKSNTKRGGEAYARAGVNASFAAANLLSPEMKSKIIAQMPVSDDAKSILNDVSGSSSAAPRHVILPTGQKVDLNSTAGRAANAQAFASLGKEANTFHVQPATDQKSNMSLTVPNAAVGGSEGQFKINRQNASLGINGSTSEISSVEKDGKRYMTPLAVAQWVNQKGIDAQKSGDTHFQRFKSITANNLIEKNSGLVKELTIKDANGKDQKVQAFEVGQTINLTAGTVEGVKGTLRAMNLVEGATQDEKKEAAKATQVSVAKMIDPQAVDSHGNIDAKRLVGTGAVKGVNGTLENLPRALGATVQGGAHLIGSALKGELPTTAEIYRKGADYLSFIPQVGDKAKNFLAAHEPEMKKMEAQERQMRDVWRLGGVGTAMGTGVKWLGDKAADLGHGTGELYANTLGKQLSTVHWMSTNGMVARDDAVEMIETAKADAASRLTHGEMSPVAAQKEIASAYVRADQHFNAAIATADERLQPELAQNSLSSIAKARNITPEQLVAQLAHDDLIAMEKGQPQTIASR